MMTPTRTSLQALAAERGGSPSWCSFFEDECQAETKNLIASTVNSATHALEDP